MTASVTIYSPVRGEPHGDDGGLPARRTEGEHALLQTLGRVMTQDIALLTVAVHCEHVLGGEEGESCGSMAAF